MNWYRMESGFFITIIVVLFYFSLFPIRRNNIYLRLY